MEPRPQLKTRIVGWVILITMLSLSFFFVPLVMRQMEFEVLPKEGVVIWLAMSAFVIAFPVMVSHLYVMAVRKYMKWLSYWFVVAVATLGLMILYRLTLSEKVYGYHIAQGMFFVSCFVGGTFGGMVVLSLIRRFAPRWLSVNLANGASQVDHRYGLKTIFVWTAAIAVIAAALTNPENVLLEERLTHNIYLGQLTGAICVGLFCALVLLPTLSWLTTVRPFWFGKLSLLVCSVVFPMTICGVFSKLTMGGSSELPLVAVYLSSVLFWLSVYAILWSTGCHWAGLIEEVPPKGKRTNVLRHIDTMSSALGRGSRYFIFATPVLSVLFALVWGVIHFAGGDERNIELINDEIHQLLDNNDTDRDWIEVINDQRSAGITAENNVAMKVLRVFNPYPVRLFQFDKRFPPKLTLISNDSEIGQQDELKLLTFAIGFTNVPRGLKSSFGSRISLCPKRLRNKRKRCHVGRSWMSCLPSPVFTRAA